jgi:rSAM/selenodomain-associated transferase 1
MKSNNLLIILTRNPQLGKVKTRLAKDVGDQKALDIYIDLLKHTVYESSLIKDDKWVSFTNQIEEDKLWDSTLFHKKLQYSGDLGIKMYSEFQEAFLKGYEKVVLIGSDNIELHHQHIQQAFARLTNNEVVLGPATDGGYYLIGMKKDTKTLFLNKKWGTDTVLRDTLENLSQLKTSYSLLEPLNDIDYLSDISNEELIKKHQLQTLLNNKI